MWLRYIHGAGGYVDDQELVGALGEALGARIDMPQMPDADMSYAAWARVVRERLSETTADDVVIAHSFGASVLLRVLAGEVRTIPSRAVLLAMPDWNPEGWDVPEYAFNGPEPYQGISLHHCRDDEDVPFDHLALNTARLPAARVHEHTSGGHQFDGLAAAIAADALAEW